MRTDQQLAKNWIRPNSRVLDLGCGDGTLLAYLTEHLGVQGYGLELDGDKINRAISFGVNVIEQDLNDGLARFGDNSFDTVVMMQALQAVKHPKELLLDMLRVAGEAVVTFPNFAYWQNRVHLGVKGMMPVSETLPHEWYDTPNIHLCTFKDFERLCFDNRIAILDNVAVSDTPLPSLLPTAIKNSPLLKKGRQTLVKKMPNLLADVAVYRITRQD